MNVPLSHLLTDANKMKLQNVAEPRKDYPGFLSALRIKLKDHKFVEFSAREFCAQHGVPREIFTFMLQKGFLEKKEVGHKRYAYKDTFKFGELNVYNIETVYTSSKRKQAEKVNKKKEMMNTPAPVLAKPVTTTKPLNGDYVGLYNGLKTLFDHKPCVKFHAKEFCAKYGINYAVISALTSAGYFTYDRGLASYKREEKFSTLSAAVIMDVYRKYQKEAQMKTLEKKGVSLTPQFNPTPVNDDIIVGNPTNNEIIDWKGSGVVVSKEGKDVIVKYPKEGVSVEANVSTLQPNSLYDNGITNYPKPFILTGIGDPEVVERERKIKQMQESMKKVIEDSFTPLKEALAKQHNRSVTLSKTMDNNTLKLTLNLIVEGEGDYTTLLEQACTLLK